MCQIVPAFDFFGDFFNGIHDIGIARVADECIAIRREGRGIVAEFIALNLRQLLRIGEFIDGILRNFDLCFEQFGEFFVVAILSVSRFEDFGDIADEVFIRE